MVILSGRHRVILATIILAALTLSASEPPPLPAPTPPLSLEDARRVTATIATESAIPLDVNEAVLKRLNELLTTPSGRGLVFRGWRNAKIHRPRINLLADQVGVPRDLIAVAIIESGLNPNAIGRGVAGMWQLTPETARAGGLKISDSIDERLDPLKSTEVALRLLKRLERRFGDWRAAFRAWNEGEGRLARLMEKHKTTDQWELERLAPSRHEFLASVTALMIILRKPELMKD